MTTRYFIGSGPYEEAMTPPDTPNFAHHNQRECALYVETLIRHFGPPPQKAQYLVVEEEQWFGVSHEVVLEFNPEEPEEQSYADKVENGCPNWDYESMQKLVNPLS